MHYDQDLQHIATDPEHPASLHLGTGDLRPRAWFAPFGNTPPRPPRTVNSRGDDLYSITAGAGGGAGLSVGFDASHTWAKSLFTF